MKKKKILVLRTAKMQVVDLLMKNLRHEGGITFLAQSNIVDELKERYPSAKVVSIGDTYFNYDSFCKNVRLNKRYDFIYVLASGIEFAEYEEVFEIVEHIKGRNVVLFNRNGIAGMERRNMSKKIRENLYFVFAKICLKTSGIWYEHFGRNYRF